MSKAPLMFKKCHRCGEQIGWDETPNPICSDCAVERITELEAENAKLRKCVVAADAYVEAVVRIEDSPAMQGVYSIAAVHHYPYNGANWSGELAQYRAARAEVDK